MGYSEAPSSSSKARGQFTPAQIIAGTTAGMGSTVHITLPSLLMSDFPPSCNALWFCDSCYHGPTTPLETNTRCGKRHCPLLSTFCFPVMPAASLSKKEDVLATKCMIRNAWKVCMEAVIDGGIDLIFWCEAMSIFCLTEDVRMHCTIQKSYSICFERSH